MKRLIMMTSTQGKTPEHVTEELTAGLDDYRRAEDRSPVPGEVEPEPQADPESVD